MLQRVALFLAVGFALFAGLGLWLNERSETRLLHTDRAPTEPTSRDIDVNAGVLRPARGGSATVRVPVIGASSKPQPQDAVTVHTDRPRTIRAREVRDDWVRIIGRFIGADSEPVSGVSILTSKRWVSRDESVMQPSDFESLQVIHWSNEEGRFDISYRAEAVFEYKLRPRVAGHASLEVLVGQLAPGSIADVGDQVLGVAGMIVGRVALPDGTATGVRWRITYGLAGAESNEPARRRPGAYSDPATGAYRIDSAAPGSVSIEAISDQAESIPGPLIRVVGGEETNHDFVYRGPDLASRIVVTVDVTDGHGAFAPDGVEVQASVASGGTWRPRKLQSGGVRFAFDDLPEGDYEIEVRSRRCSPWTKGGVRPGQSVSAKLEGSASLSLVVVDARSGSLIDSYGVETHYDGASPSTWKRIAYGRRFEPEKGDILRHLVPPAFTLVFDADGFEGKQVRVDDLQHEERRELRVELERSESAAGTGRNLRDR